MCLNQQRRSDSEKRKIKTPTTIITRISRITKNPQKIKNNKPLSSNLLKIKILRQTIMRKTKSHKRKRNPHLNKKKSSQPKTIKTPKTNRKKKSHRKNNLNQRLRKNHNPKMRKSKNQKIPKPKSRTVISHQKIKTISSTF